MFDPPKKGGGGGVEAKNYAVYISFNYIYKIYFS